MLGRHGFRPTGRGGATFVGTASLYRPGSTHRVRVRCGRPTREGRLRTDRQGRLRLTVPLGREADATALISVDA